MATVVTQRLTAEEFWEWCGRPENEGRRFELVEGEVEEVPSPSELHGVVYFLILRLLGNYVFGRGRGFVCANDAGLIVRRDPDTVRGPDAMLIDEPVTLAGLSRCISERTPALIVEVLSPSDRLTRVARRVNQYLQRGVPLIWVVDPEDQTVLVYRPGELHQLAEGNDELNGGPALPDLRLRVADLFALPGGTASAPA